MHRVCAFINGFFVLVIFFGIACFWWARGWSKSDAKSHFNLISGVGFHDHNPASTWKGSPLRSTNQVGPSLGQLWREQRGRSAPHSPLWRIVLSPSVNERVSEAGFNKCATLCLASCGSSRISLSTLRFYANCRFDRWANMPARGSQTRDPLFIEPDLQFNFAFLITYRDFLWLQVLSLTFIHLFTVYTRYGRVFFSDDYSRNHFFRLSFDKLRYYEKLLSTAAW